MIVHFDNTYAKNILSDDYTQNRQLLFESAKNELNYSNGISYEEFYDKNRDLKLNFGESIILPIGMCVKYTLWRPICNVANLSFSTLMYPFYGGNSLSTGCYTTARDIEQLFGSVEMLTWDTMGGLYHVLNARFNKTFYTIHSLETDLPYDFYEFGHSRWGDSGIMVDTRAREVTLLEYKYLTQSDRNQINNRLHSTSLFDDNYKTTNKMNLAQRISYLKNKMGIDVMSFIYTTDEELLSLITLRDITVDPEFSVMRIALLSDNYFLNSTLNELPYVRYNDTLLGVESKPKLSLSDMIYVKKRLKLLEKKGEEVDCIDITTTPLNEIRRISPEFVGENIENFPIEALVLLSDEQLSHVDFSSLNEEQATALLVFLDDDEFKNRTSLFQVEDIIESLFTKNKDRDKPYIYYSLHRQSVKILKKLLKNTPKEELENLDIDFENHKFICGKLFPEWSEDSNMEIKNENESILRKLSPATLESIYNHGYEDNQVLIQGILNE